MKKILLSLSMLSVYLVSTAQDNYYLRGYFGADFGAVSSTKLINTDYKVAGIRMNDFQIAIKGGIWSENLKETYALLLEGEVRSDKWQYTSTWEGTFASVSAGIDIFIGEKGYLDLLTGWSYALVDDTGRPKFSIRLGKNQIYGQATLMPRTSRTQYRPTQLYLSVGFKSFSYANVNWK